MSELAFMSPNRAAPSVRVVSPLSRFEGIHDVSEVGKLEVRGNLDGVEIPYEVIRFGGNRALVICEPSATSSALAELRTQFRYVYDLTAGLAVLEIEGEQLMRRLTELDLGQLPATGAVARGTPALIQRRHGETFRIFVPQELGHFVAEFVLDQQEGLTPESPARDQEAHP